MVLSDVGIEPAGMLGDDQRHEAVLGFEVIKRPLPDGDVFRRGDGLEIFGSTGGIKAGSALLGGPPLVVAMDRFDEPLPRCGRNLFRALPSPGDRAAGCGMIGLLYDENSASWPVDDDQIQDPNATSNHILVVPLPSSSSP